MSRPDFSGRWRFRADASTLQIATPDEAVFTIVHREPFSHLERTLVFGGHRDDFELDLTVGASNPPFARGDATLHPSLRWDGDQLVFLTRIVRGAEEATNLVGCGLEEAGTILSAQEHFRGSSQSYENRWVLEKER